MASFNSYLSLSALNSTTSIRPPLDPNLITARDFGWYWEVPNDVAVLLREMIQRNKVINVWETHQFKAIERLLGVERLNFPANFDQALHGTFKAILVIELSCKSSVRRGDLVDALEHSEKAIKLLQAASDEIAQIDGSIVSWLEAQSRSLQFLICEHEKLAKHVRSLAQLLEADLQIREGVHQRFRETKIANSKGRPSNWVAEVVAMKAADIYRTSYPGEISRSGSSKRPSFLSFLEDFCIGIPDAERADKRELARNVWSGNFRGAPFAPVGHL